METQIKIPTVIADNGVQHFLEQDIELICIMAGDQFVNEHNNLEYRYTDNEVCDHYDISNAELERIKRAYYS